MVAGLAEGRGGRGGRQREWNYPTYEALVAAEGQEFQVAASPREHGEWLAEYGVELGPEKECFSNAGRHLLGGRPRAEGVRGVYYAEGYAHAIIPIHHAWLVTADGRVLDPTWHGQPLGGREGERHGETRVGLALGRAYMGVAFSTEALCAKLAKSRTWGMFDYADPELLVHGVDAVAVRVGQPETEPHRDGAVAL